MSNNRGFPETKPILEGTPFFHGPVWTPPPIPSLEPHQNKASDKGPPEGGPVSI